MSNEKILVMHSEFCCVAGSSPHWWRLLKDLLGLFLNLFSFTVQSTPLDKGSRYFQGRGNAPLALQPHGQDEVSDDEIFWRAALCRVTKETDLCACYKAEPWFTCSHDVYTRFCWKAFESKGLVPVSAISCMRASQQYEMFENRHFVYVGLG